MAYIKQSWESLWERCENNLSNPEVYSEPCQTSKIESFLKFTVVFFLNTPSYMFDRIPNTPL